MKNLAGLFSLLIPSVLAFYSASVDVANKTVGVDTNYTISLALTDNYISIPARFKIEVIFPSTLSLKGQIGSLPSYCSVNDVPEIVITTVYNASSPSVNQQDSDLDAQCGISGSNKLTLITPKVIDVIITFKVGLVTNPNVAFTSSNMGTIQMLGYLEGSSTASYSISYSFSNSYFTPSDIIRSKFDQDNLKVGGWSTYSYSLSISKDIPASGWLIITFTSDSSLKSAAETQASGQVGQSSASKSLGVNINGLTITLTGLSSSLIPSGSEIFFNLTSIKNPRFVGYSSGSVFTSTNNNELIEKTSFSISAINPCAITLTGFIPVNRFVLSTTQIAFYFSNDIYDSSYTNQFYFTLAFPTSYVVASNSACINAGGIATSPSLACTVSNNQFTSNLITQIDKTVAIRFTNIVNPPNNVTTEYLKLYLYTSANTLICMNDQIVNFTASPAGIVIKSKSRSSEFVSDVAWVGLSFVTTTVIPTGAFLKVVVPNDQIVETTGITCREPSSNQNICSKLSSPLDPDTTELLIPEYCSSTDTTCSSCCKSGTTFTLNITGIRNPMYLDPSVSSNLRIYTYNPSQTGVIDLITNGGQLQPALSTRSGSGQISRSVDTVQLDTSYSLSFTSLSDYLQSSYIQITLPSSLTYPSTLTCLSSGASVTCSYDTNSNGSVKSFKVFICSAACSAGTFFNLQIMGLKNPVTTSNVTGSFAYNVFYSSFKVESGSLASSVSYFVPNVVSGFVISRSSNVVGAYCNVSFAFKIASKVPAGGEILVKVPENLLVTDLSVLVLKGNRVLQVSGNMSEFRIVDYCDSECSAGAVVNFTVVGIKNPDSVITVSGTILISTRYSSLIDSGSADISTLLSPLSPGKIYNSEIHPTDPTISSNTSYRIIFTTEHSIPSGSIIEITMSSGLQYSAITCSEYLTIESSLTCSRTSNTITVRNGFFNTLKGSYMVGVLIYGITNPSSAITFTGFRITLKDVNGYVIDQSGILQVTYFAPAVSCSCSKCSGSVCYECLIPGNNPFLQDYSCMAQCDSGYFLTLTQPYTCIKCHFTCKTCSSHLSSDCLSCIDGYYKSDGTCVTSCPSGTFLSGSDCTSTSPCTSPCDKCSKSPNYCLSCQNGYKLTAGTGSCELQCPKSYYWDGSNCVSCYYKCSQCVSASNCTSCLSYYYEQVVSNGVCVASCPAGVSVLKGSKCVNCDSTCFTCYDVGKSDCINCTGTRYLYQGTCVEVCPSGMFRSSGNLCIGVCPAGFFVTDDLKDCVACDSSCLTCAGSSLCLSCSQGLFLYEGACSSNCPTGYLKTSEKICIKKEDCGDGSYVSKDWCYDCNSECQTCSSLVNCSSCATGYYLFNNTCSTNCPKGMVKIDNICINSSTCLDHLYIENDKCLPCSDSCGNCSSQTTCTTCKSSTYLLFGQCVQDCPEGYYKYSNNTCLSNCPPATYPTHSSCAECESGCLTCQNSSTCFQCSPSLYLTQDFHCVSTCPTGYHAVNSNCELTCEDEDCDKCQNSSQTCVSCKSGTYLKDGLCVNYCPDGMFEDSNKCLSCMDGCSHCETLDKCEQCAEGKKMIEGTCADQCPEKFFDLNGVCEKCIDGCDVCGNNQKCEQCENGKVWFKGKCLEKCMDGFEDVDGTCRFVCPESCSRCAGEKCVECKDGVAFEGNCLDVCPDGYFEDKGKCSQCDSKCDSCHNTSTCLHCKDPYLHYNSSCLESCPENTTSQNGTCLITCPENCQKCTISECESCNTNYGLHKGSCVVCPSGTYLDSGKCENCVSDCSECSSLNDCSSCSTKNLFESQCVTVCPQGYTAKLGTCIVELQSKESSNQGFLVYVLIVEFLIIMIVLVLAGFIRSDSYLMVPSGLALFNFLIFNSKVFLLAALWNDGHPASAVLVPFLSSLVIGTSSLGVIFVFMHLDPLTYQSSNLEYYKTLHPHAFTCLKSVVMLCGSQLIRLIYSGLFGLACTTESKSLALSTRFRAPLEKLSQLNVFIITVPLLILCIICVSLFSITTDVWQVSLFTLIISLAIEGFFIVNYYKFSLKISY